MFCTHGSHRVDHCHPVRLLLQVVGGDSGAVVCGAGTDFLVQPHDRGTAAAPRRLSSPEALSATVTGEASKCRVAPRKPPSALHT